MTKKEAYIRACITIMSAFIESDGMNDGVEHVLEMTPGRLAAVANVFASQLITSIEIGWRKYSGDPSISNVPWEDNGGSGGDIPQEIWDHLANSNIHVNMDNVNVWDSKQDKLEATIEDIDPQNPQEQQMDVHVVGNE